MGRPSFHFYYSPRLQQLLELTHTVLEQSRRTIKILEQTKLKMEKYILIMFRMRVVIIYFRYTGRKQYNGWGLRCMRVIKVCSLD